MLKCIKDESRLCPRLLCCGSFFFCYNTIVSSSYLWIFVPFWGSVFPNCHCNYLLQFNSYLRTYSFPWRLYCFVSNCSRVCLYILELGISFYSLQNGIFFYRRLLRAPLIFLKKLNGFQYLWVYFGPGSLIQIFSLFWDTPSSFTSKIGL